MRRRGCPAPVLQEPRQGASVHGSRESPLAARRPATAHPCWEEDEEEPTSVSNGEKPAFESEPVGWSFFPGRDEAGRLPYTPDPREGVQWPPQSHSEPSLVSRSGAAGYGGGTARVTRPNSRPRPLWVQLPSPRKFGPRRKRPRPFLLRAFVTRSGCRAYFVEKTNAKTRGVSLKEKRERERDGEWILSSGERISSGSQEFSARDQRFFGGSVCACMYFWMLSKLSLPTSELQCLISKLGQPTSQGL